MLDGALANTMKITNSNRTANVTRIGRRETLARDLVEIESFELAGEVEPPVEV